MAALITIKIPRECVSPREFAQLEGLAEDTVRKLTRSGKLPIAPKTISPGKNEPVGLLKFYMLDTKKLGLEWLWGIPVSKSSSVRDSH